MSKKAYKICSNKNCSSGGEPLEMDEFYSHAHTRDGKQSWCKSCINGNTKMQRARKKEAKMAVEMEALGNKLSSAWFDKIIRKAKESGKKKGDSNE